MQESDSVLALRDQLKQELDFKVAEVTIMYLDFDFLVVEARSSRVKLRFLDCVAVGEIVE